MSTPTGPAITRPPYSASGAQHQVVHAPVAVQYSPGHSRPVPVAAVLKGGTPGVAYSETISAQGGTPSYTYAVTSGAVPTGTSLNTSSGVISGTPSATATFTFTITVTDSLGYTGSQAFSITIAAVAGGGGAYTFIA